MAVTDRYYWQEQEHRVPCDCTECGNCEDWVSLEGDATYPLQLRDAGNCYSRTKNNIAVILPDRATLPNTYCLQFRNTSTPYGNLFVRDNADPTGAFFVINDVLYQYFTVNNGGEACVCFNGTYFIVTGGVTGWNYT